MIQPHGVADDLAGKRWRRYELGPGVIWSASPACPRDASRDELGNADRSFAANVYLAVAVIHSRWISTALV